MGLFKVAYQVFIAGVVNKAPIAPAPRQRTNDKIKSLIFFKLERNFIKLDANFIRNFL